MVAKTDCGAVAMKPSLRQSVGRRLPFLLAVGVVISSLAVTNSLANTQQQDEAAIRLLLTQVTKAYREKDADAAMAPYADEVVTFDIMPPLEAVGFQRNLETTRTVLAATDGPFTVDYSDIHLTVDHDHAYGRYIVHVAAKLHDGRVIDMLERTTDVWERRGEKWLIVHEHNSVPVDMVTGVATMKAAMGGVARPFR